MIGAFVGWYFLTPSDDEVKVEKAEVVAQVKEDSEPQLPGNDYEEGTGRSAVYNFFYHVFGGIEDGIENSPHNLKNVEHIDDMNLDKQPFSDSPTGARGNGLEAALALKKNARTASGGRTAARLAQISPAAGNAGGAVTSGSGNSNLSGAKPQDQYRHSVYDIVGSEVYNSAGNQIGMIHDILTDKKTGKAKAIIVNNGRDLAAIDLSDVTQQQEGEAAVFTVEQEKATETPQFSYESFKENDKYVSLRQLRDGQVIDFDGNPSGDIDAIIYENEEAQNIYFTLRPSLALQGPSKFFMPFKDVNIVKKENGYNIRLNKKQTETLAEMVFERNRQAQISP